MKTFELQEKVMEEIRRIPENRLSDIYDLIHFFRLGLESDRKDAKKIMRFAGCWQDMTDREFREFSEEVSDRRKKALRTERRQSSDWQGSKRE